MGIRFTSPGVEPELRSERLTPLSNGLMKTLSILFENPDGTEI